jgi:hypothetical protein
MDTPARLATSNTVAFGMGDRGSLVDSQEAQSTGGENDHKRIEFSYWLRKIQPEKTLAAPGCSHL